MILVALAAVIPVHSHAATVAEEIKSINETFMSLFASGDMNGLSQLYTENCRIMPTGTDVIEGRYGTHYIRCLSIRRLLRFLLHKCVCPKVSLAIPDAT